MSSMELSKAPVHSGRRTMTGGGVLPKRIWRARADAPSDSLTASDFIPGAGWDNPHTDEPVKIEFQARRHTARWLSDVAARLSELTVLDRDWHISGARPIDEKSVIYAMTIARELAERGMPQPAVIPAVDGSVQLEWETPRVDLEIRISGWDEAEVVFSDPDRDAEFEAPIALIRDKLAQICRRVVETSP